MFNRQKRNLKASWATGNIYSFQINEIRDGEKVVTNTFILRP